MFKIKIKFKKDWGEREMMRGKEGVLMVYVILDLMLRIRCKIEMNAAQLRCRYINLAHIKVSNEGGYRNTR